MVGVICTKSNKCASDMGTKATGLVRSEIDWRIKLNKLSFFLTKKMSAVVDYC